MRRRTLFSACRNTSSNLTPGQWSRKSSRSAGSKLLPMKTPKPSSQATCSALHGQAMLESYFHAMGTRTPHPSTPLLTHFAFIGMSGTGKTFWSKRLEAAGHRTVSCDDLIGRRLAEHLPNGNRAGINDLAAWMGWPDSASYAERESQYLT